ncbi:coiled-coil domain-containing protein 97 [Teleopsis dalmanni]|uniref:coiled-coil domain-containing protein 97 n=1 Tax=Teleopsis dalmanni TaxID=139649 RepID=UPI0018CE3ACD|nr:coiled-coil domain-containing protein 97 [Teleopsis dalmanni]
MTADVEITEADKLDQPRIGSSIITFPAEIANIFDFLSLNDQIVFKSQQIDDPELQRNEKVDIAKEIYSKNRQTFLMRFGCFLNAEQLTNFANILMLEHTDNALKMDENYEEMRLLLTDFQHKLHTRELAIKNRRYVALQNLIEKGEYFSEYEMMIRAPELYQELVGQYLSKSEKDIRDSYDVKNTSFSGILWHTVQRKEMQELLTAADESNRRENDFTAQQRAIILPNAAEAQIIETDSSDECTNDAYTEASDNSVDVNVPPAFRQQWGNFDDEKVACSESRERKTFEPKQSPKNNIDANRSFITAGERNLLRQEFVDIMYEQFLSGKDKDFDYTQVDDNSNLDDLKQLEQDKEDAYFESSDNDEFEERSANAIELADESEDELDVYMSHLNKHHSLNKKK